MISKQIVILGIGVLMFFAAGFAIAETAKAKLYIPELEVKSGQTFQVPVKINPAERLAGMKLVLKYDPGLIEFKKVEKTEFSADMMHVVNDKKPGQLIIVMAGAKGISGKDIPLCNISFIALPGTVEKRISNISITEIELMSDGLKPIPSVLSNSRISVLPAKVR